MTALFAGGAGAVAAAVLAAATFAGMIRGGGLGVIGGTTGSIKRPVGPDADAAAAAASTCLAVVGSVADDDDGGSGGLATGVVADGGGSGVVSDSGGDSCVVVADGDTCVAAAVVVDGGVGGSDGTGESGGSRACSSDSEIGAARCAGAGIINVAVGDSAGGEKPEVRAGDVERSSGEDVKAE